MLYCVQILIHHIRDCLPEIKSKLNTMMLSVHQELGELGEPTDTVSQSSLGATLLTLLSKFATNFQVGQSIFMYIMLASNVKIIINSMLAHFLDWSHELRLMLMLANAYTVIPKHLFVCYSIQLRLCCCHYCSATDH
jgi:Dynamin central region